MRTHSVGLLLPLLGLASIAACSSAPSSDASSSPTLSTPPAPRAYGSAHVEVPAGSTCTAHPEGDADPKHALPVQVDIDGVARFQAVRASRPGDVARLALDCVAASGARATYVAELSSDATFAPRPFDAARSGLPLRPALEGDPMAYEARALLEAGYGPRPDPTANPKGFALWLQSARLPMYVFGRTPTALDHSTSSPARAEATTTPSSRPEQPDTAARPLAAPVNVTAPPWTGAILTGGFQPNGNASLASAYVSVIASFAVPTIVPRSFDSGTTTLTIWGGLDNTTLLQGIVDVHSNATVGSYGIHSQWFAPHSGVAVADRFTPAAGDQIMDTVSYCDANGFENINGGYGCIYMSDLTQKLAWDCTLASSTGCASYKLTGSATLGTSAELIVENDTIQHANDNDWPDFGSASMTGVATIVKGGVASSATTTTDTAVQLAGEWANDVPAQVSVALTGTEGVQWTLGPTQNLGKLFGAPTSWSSASFSAPTLRMGDVNGDGTADAVAVGAGATWVMLSNGSTFGAPQEWSSTPFQGSVATFLGDLTGDYIDDLVEVNGNSVYVMPSSGTQFLPAFLLSNASFYGTVATQFADVNGDAKPDLVAFDGTSTWVMNALPIAGGKFATTFSAPQQWSTAAFQGSVATTMGDVNGDGYVDAVAFDGGSTWVMLSNGTSFGAPQEWSSTAFQGTIATVVGDVNGDGRADAVAFDGNSTWVMLSTTVGFGAPTQWSSALFEGTSTLGADVTGDGKADAVALSGNSAFVMPALVSAPPPPPLQPTITLSTSSLTVEQNQSNVGDVVSASVTGWSNPANVTFTVSGLPAGVTAKWVQTSGYIPPAQGVAGAIELTASSSAPLGEQATVTVTGTSGATSASAQVHVTVQGTCVPATSCGTSCGTIGNGCGGTLTCKACGGLTCPVGQHNCGGYCTKYVCN